MFLMACSHCSGDRADKTKIKTMISNDPGSMASGIVGLARSHTNACALDVSYNGLLLTTWTAVLEKSAAYTNRSGF